MKNIFTTKNIVVAFTLVWIVFSVGYIIRDQWQDFQNGRVQAAYQQGLTDTVRTLMGQVASCNPIPLFDGDTRVEVIAVSCLQQAQEQ